MKSIESIDETRQEHDLARLRQRNEQVSFTSLSLCVCANRLISVIETIFCARYMCVSVRGLTAHFLRDNYLPMRMLPSTERGGAPSSTFCSHVCKKRKKKNRVKMVEPIDCCYYYWIYMHRRALVQPIAEWFAIESWKDKSKIRTTPCAT